MKASVKLRDGKEPLLRAKLPLSMFGVPFSSGVNVGSNNELGLHVSTLFDAGPLCRVTFRPNDSQSPLRLMLKAGVGAWGSPNGASFVMSAELNVPAQGQSPSFSFFIKPRVGDFGLSKDLRALSLPKASQEHSELTRKITKENGDLQRSPSLRVAELAKAFVKPEDSPDGSKNVFKVSGKVKENASPEFIKDRQLKIPGPEDECVVVEFPETGKETVRMNSGGGLKGWNLVAHSSLPLGPRMLAGIRWRMKIPFDFDNLACEPQTFLSCLQMPVLALDKMSLESREPPQQQQKKDLSSSGQRLIEDALLLEESRELNRVASMCASMRRQLHLLHSENQVLRNTMEEMRSNLNNHRGSSIFSDKSSSKGLIERAMVAEPEGAAHHQQLSDGLHGNWNEGKMDMPLSRGGGKSKGQVFDRESTTQATQATQATRADGGGATNNNKGQVLGGVASEPQASDIAEELKKAIANSNLGK